MNINKKVYAQFPELTRLYRFEGASSLHNFDFSSREPYCSDSLNYVYFSKNIKHHQYYCKKRIEKLINGEILPKQSDIKLCYNTLINLQKFRELIRFIENCQIDDKLISIEFSLPESFEYLLDSNCINNKIKNCPDRRIEIVDTTKHQGGFGFCGEWLTVFNILTYFYSYQRITKENLIHFLHLYRKALTCKIRINPMEFLMYPNNRVIKINQSLFEDFSKYILMDALENIIEKNLYFQSSIFENKPNERIKKIIRQYIMEREQILTCVESEYQKRI